VIQQNMTDCN